MFSSCIIVLSSPRVHLTATHFENILFVEKSMTAKVLINISELVMMILMKYFPNFQCFIVFFVIGRIQYVKRIRFGVEIIPKPKVG